MNSKDHIIRFVEAEEDGWLNSRQALRYMRRESLGYLHNLTSAGLIQFDRKPNGHLRFRPEWLDEFMSRPRKAAA